MSLNCSEIQDSRNVNASVRALNSSPTLDGRRPIYIKAQKGPQHFNSVLRSTAASTLSDVLVHAADLSGLMATVRRGSFKRTDHNGAAAREYSSAKFDVRKKTGSMHVENVSKYPTRALPY